MFWLPACAGLHCLGIHQRLRRSIQQSLLNPTAEHIVRSHWIHFFLGKTEPTNLADFARLGDASQEGEKRRLRERRQLKIQTRLPCNNGTSRRLIYVTDQSEAKLDANPVSQTVSSSKPQRH
mmetsp:Transcript_24001/g.55404  ORF Transcript_24001/g.55404 Transcript_24001/m.55404 type:complete len:122 (+) Transcript_24001:854-1219(+)